MGNPSWKGYLNRYENGYPHNGGHDVGGMSRSPSFDSWLRIRGNAVREMVVDGGRDATDLDEALRQLLAKAQELAAQSTHPDAATLQDAVRL